MTLTYVLVQNLRRSPLRTTLTAVAFALPMGIFVVAISLVASLREAALANERELRLAVHHRITLTNILPEGMRRKIEALDPQRERLSAVCGMRWFGGRRPNSPNTLTTLAADMDTFPSVYSDVGMTAEEVEAWRRERRAAIVGTNLAEEARLAVGSRFSLESSIPPYLELEFIVVKIMPQDSKASLMYFRRDYLEDSLREADFPLSGCNIFWVKCTTAAAMPTLQQEIDALFANSPNETVTQDENAFISNFVQATGNIPGLIQAISLVVVFIIALIAGNTVMMSFRERIRELAVFKAIGFPSRRIFRMVLAESVLLAVSGSLLGVLPVSLGLALHPVKGLFLGPIGGLTVSPIGVAGALSLAVLIGLAAGLWPALQAWKLRTVDALRTAA